MSEAGISRWEEWRDSLIPASQVSRRPPAWRLPGLLVPGVNLLVAPPKTFKSTLALHIMAAVAHQHPMKGVVLPDATIPVAPKRELVVAICYEQGAGRLRHMYERRVLGRELLPRETQLCFVHEPWTWQVDDPAAPERDVFRLIDELRPAVLVIDPLVQSHSLDENDPAMVKPLIRLKEHALKANTAVLIVHHANKAKDQLKGSDGKAGSRPTMDFDRVRGTSALWAMADSGHLMARAQGNVVYMVSNFKDFPARNWIWRVPKPVWAGTSRPAFNRGKKR